MPVQIRYPGSVQGPDLSSIEDGLGVLGKRLGERRDERKRAELEASGATLYEKLFSQNGGSPASIDGQVRPMSIAGLAPQGQVTRAPLADAAMDPSQRVARGFSDEQSAMPTAAPKQDRLPQTGDIFGRFIRTVRAGGVTNPAALAAIASTGKRESGFRPENAFGEWSDPSQSGEAGQAGGIMSWRGPRLQSLRQFAQQAGDDPRSPSPETQAQFLLREDPSLIQKLQQARDPQEAQGLMNAAWRFAGYDQPGGETAARMQEAEAYAQQFGGGPSQQALEGLEVGQAMPMGAESAPASAPQAGGGFNLDPALMKQLFANPTTRPLAIDLAKTRLSAMQDQNDPMKQLAFEKARLEVDQLRRGDSKPTDDMREYQFSQRDPNFAQYQLDQKRASSTQVNVGSEKGFDKTVGEGYGKRFLDVQEGAQSAQRAMNALDVMEQSMADPGFYSGTGAGAVANLKRLGASLGMQGAEGIDSIETFNALSKQAALDSMGGSLGSGFSNADRDFVTGQVPTLDNSPQGNRALIGIQRKLNQRKQEVAQLARQYASKNDGRIDAGFDDYLSQWAQQNPLFPQRPQGSGASPGAGSSTGRQRARNPQTGETLEWDGRQWSPVR